MTVLRSTQQITQVLQNADPALRSTQQIVQVLQNANPALRSTQQIVQVLYGTLLPVGPLTVAFTASATVSLELNSLNFKSSAQCTATVTANLTGIRQFAVSYTGSANLQSNVLSIVKLASGITTTATVVAAIRKNIEYLVADVVCSGVMTDPYLNVPWHPGSTLGVQHTVDLNIIKSESLEDTLDLQDTMSHVFGKRFLSVADTLNIDDDLVVTRLLPTKTASDDLSLTDEAVQSRLTEGFLTLEQVASGEVVFIEGAASSELNLTDSNSVAGSIFARAAENQLNLTHLATTTRVGDHSASNTLVLANHAFAVVLGAKTYVLLQAPFGLIQTSVIIPNPLLDDNQSLVSNLTLRRSMDNTVRTYVKKSLNHRLRYTFSLSRLKSLELEAFFDSYNGADIKMLNWKGEIWKVKLITNPVDFVQTGRAEPGGDRTDVNVEFEGVMVNG
jgi:hypothetical protein